MTVVSPKIRASPGSGPRADASSSSDLEPGAQDEIQADTADRLLRPAGGADGLLGHRDRPG